MTSFDFITMTVAGGAFGGFAGAQICCPNWLSRLICVASGSVAGLIGAFLVLALEVVR